MCITYTYTHTHTRLYIYIYTHTHTHMENNYHTSVLAMVFDTKSKCNNSQNCLSFLHFLFKFYFSAAPLSMWLLVLQPQIELTPSALEAWSPKHWLPRESQNSLSFLNSFYSGLRPPMPPKVSHGPHPAKAMVQPWTPQQWQTHLAPPPSSDSFLPWAPRLVFLAASWALPSQSSLLEASLPIL